MKVKTIFFYLAIVLIPTLSWAQNVPPKSTSPDKPTMAYHGISPTLEYLSKHPVPLELGNGQFQEDHVEELYKEPFEHQITPPKAPFVQTSIAKPFAAVAGVSFEGPGTGLAGFTLTGAPPDHTLAVGPNHIVAWVNSQYAVFDKTGNVLMAPTNGNSLFTGLGNECETTNRGDPILQYDRLADRWILSQFAFAVSGGAPVAPYFQCFAVSTTGDPTGTYVRYSVQFSSTSPSGFPDYGKIGIWPDAYYTSYVMFGGSPAGGNTGTSLCASDRTKMLAGDPAATTLCAPIQFYAGGSAFLPADVDGITPPSDLTQGGIFMRVSSNQALRYLKLKPDFPNGTVTLTDGFGGGAGSFINLPTALQFSCNGSGGTCVPQPDTTNLLATLGSRLMYRLAYRNRSGVESMMVTHSVDPDGSGAQAAALRWYEIRNPLGDPNDTTVANRPFIYQSGTFYPGSTGDRWMGSIAMDKNGNIMAGYSIADVSTGLKPSIGIAGREVNDPLNTLQTEIIALTGTGSQNGTLSRWGDYSTIQVDPVDDLTFWYIGEYLSVDGTFNWRTRIVSYKFPVPASVSIDDVNITEGNSGTSTAQFTITRTNTDDAVSVQVDTADNTANSGSDFVAISGQVVNFSAGGLASKTVSVTINGDTDLEANETFNVNLSNASGATISDNTGIGTILNDDNPTISIDDVTQVEGNSGTSSFVFTVTLSGGTVPAGFTVPFSTIDGTATQPNDYTSINGNLSFTGSLNETQTISVDVAGDIMFEADETFTVELGTPSNALVSVSNNVGTGTITNDDMDDLIFADGFE